MVQLINGGEMSGYHIDTYYTNIASTISQDWNLLVGLCECVCVQERE